MEADGVEIHVAPDQALVVVDREPYITTEDGRTFLRTGINGLVGTHLTLRGGVEVVNETVLHGSYSGTLEGTPVHIDQYLEERNGMPITLVRVIRRSERSAPVPPSRCTAFVLSLLKDRPDSTDTPALTQQ